MVRPQQVILYHGRQSRKHEADSNMRKVYFAGNLCLTSCILLLTGCSKHLGASNPRGIAPPVVASAQPGGAPVLQGKPTSVDYPVAGVSLGQGWTRGINQKASTVCVDFSPVQNAAQDKTMQIVSADDKSSLMNQLEVSAEVQVKAIVGSASAKTDFVQKVELKNEFSNFSVIAHVQNGANYASPDANGVMDLKPQFAKLAKSNPGAFYNQCGDSFVSALYGGAELDALITIQTHSIDQQTSLKNSIQASGWGVSLSGSVASAMDAASQQNELAIHFTQSGGSGDPLPTDQATLNTAIQNLPKAAAVAPSYSKIDLTPYSLLPSWPTGIQSFSAQSYARIAQRYGEFVTLRDEVESILATPGTFILGHGVTVQSLKDMDDAMLKHLQNLTTTATNCINSTPPSCQIDPADDLSDYQFRILLPVAVGSFAEDVALSQALSDLSAKQATLAQQQAALQNMDPNENFYAGFRRLHEASVNAAQVGVNQAQANLARLQAKYPQALQQAIGKQWIENVVADRCQQNVLDSECIMNAAITSIETKIVTQ